MILNIYYDRGSYDSSKNDDILDIIYKDMDTGKKYVETIKNPKYEIWVVKPEFRTFDYIRNWVKKDLCDRHIISYKNRFKEAANILKCPFDQVKYSPYLLQFDIELEHFYLMQFALEYGNNLQKKLSCGYIDIEADIINIPVSRFAEPGEAPINCISYLDSSRTPMQMYTLVNITDNLPNVPPESPKYLYYEGLRKQFSTQTQQFVENVEEFINHLSEKYNEFYGDIQYNILIFDDERNMLETLFKILRLSDNDFLEIWNAPYDLSNLVERPRALGLNPDELIVDPDFGPGRRVYYKEDNNHLVHKRKHIFNTYTKYIVTDQMVNYTGIRSAKGKLPSVKLNAIARAELKDEKLDYSEYGNIRIFPYQDFKKFIEYNIKDVLLQRGIGNKTKDINSIYTTISMDGVTSNQVFTSTLVVGNSLRAFAYTRGFVFGSNRNKLYKNDDFVMSEDEISSFDENYDDSEDDSDDIIDNNVEAPETDEKEKKREKFAGAMVMAPQHMHESGYKILGTVAKFIHSHVIDEDIGGEYPSAMLIMDSSNETMVGKVILLEPNKVKVKFYDNFYFVDKKDELGYEKTKDPSNLMVEWLTQNDPLDFGYWVLNLPEATSILDHISDNIDDFISK
jgi:hypothetical protein